MARGVNCISERRLTYFAARFTCRLQAAPRCSSIGKSTSQGLTYPKQGQPCLPISRHATTSKRLRTARSHRHAMKRTALLTYLEKSLSFQWLARRRPRARVRRPVLAQGISKHSAECGRSRGSAKCGTQAGAQASAGWERRVADGALSGSSVELPGSLKTASLRPCRARAGPYRSRYGGVRFWHRHTASHFAPRFLPALGLFAFQLLLLLLSFVRLGG